MFFPIGDSPNPRNFTPWINWSLIAANVLIYLFITVPLSQQGVSMDNPLLHEYLRAIVPELPKGITVDQVLSHISAYDLYTFLHGYKSGAPDIRDLFYSMFLHGGLLHLAGNMLFLWIYGNNVEFRLGRIGYILTYLSTGVAATLFFSLLADASMTHDIDFAHAGKNISLVLNAGMTVQTHEAIQSLEMGFLPVSGLGGKTGGAYLIPNEKEFRLDFLTPVGRDGEVPYEHPDLHVTLQPLKFMEYSLENVQQSALICGNQAVIVNVPHPARYALHKLIVVTLREGAFQIKTHKDLMQAGMLLSALKATRPWEVEDAWEDLISRGKGWSSRADHGMKQLCRMFPEEAFDQWLKAP